MKTRRSRKILTKWSTRNETRTRTRRGEAQKQLVNEENKVKNRDELKERRKNKTRMKI